MPFAILLVIALVSLAAGQPAALPGPHDACLGVLLPLYNYPAWYSPPDYLWDDVAVANGQAPIVTIINPFNGPVSPPNSDYVQGMNDLLAGDVKMIGYVATNYATRPITEVENEVDIYVDDYWPWITGIFFDEASSSSLDVGYYQQLYDYVHAATGLDLVAINPGAHTDEAYFSQPAADVGVIFETDASAWPGYTPAPYVDDYEARRFAMLAYNVPDVATTESHIDLAIARNFGHVYLTDDSLPNPWDALPAFWQAQIDYIEQYNAFCPYDLNRDGVVDVADIAEIAAAWPATDPASVGRYDFNGNGGVDVIDVMVVAGRWQETWPPLQ